MPTNVDGDKRSFGQRFNELRGDLSQTEFAKKLGISKASVGFYENGQRVPDIIVLRTIAEKCNVTADYLVGLTDSPCLELDERIVTDTTGLKPKAVRMLKGVHQLETMDAEVPSAADGTHEDSLIRDAANIMLEKWDFYEALQLLGRAAKQASTSQEPAEGTDKEKLETFANMMTACKKHGYAAINKDEYTRLTLQRAKDSLSQVAETVYKRLIEQYTETVTGGAENG